jgi:hypothetical protein
MPTGSETAKVVIIQFFDNGEDSTAREWVLRIEAAGYAVRSIPTSGPPAIWARGHEAVGRTAIGGFAEDLIKRAASS